MTCYHKNRKKTGHGIGPHFNQKIYNSKKPVKRYMYTTYECLNCGKEINTNYQKFVSFEDFALNYDKIKSPCQIPTTLTN